MKQISPPAHSEPDNFKRFIKNKKEVIKARLQSILNVLPVYYKAYFDSCPDCHLIENEPFGERKTKDILYLYEAYTTAEIKKYRNELFLLSLKCPYCCLNETQTLDHYLPKSKFPEYTLFSFNLIPVCYICNSKYKKEKYRNGESRLFIHPYIDNINELEIYLAIINSSNGVIKLNYIIDLPDDTDNELRVVINNHFESLELNSRFKKFGLDYISNMSDAFRIELENGTLEDSISTKYIDCIAENGLNHWKSALLKALMFDPSPLIDTL